MMAAMRVAGIGNAVRLLCLVQLGAVQYHSDMVDMTSLTLMSGQDEHAGSV